MSSVLGLLTSGPHGITAPQAGSTVGHPVSSWVACPSPTKPEGQQYLNQQLSKNFLPLAHPIPAWSQGTFDPGNSIQPADTKDLGQQ